MYVSIRIKGHLDPGLWKDYLDGLQIMHEIDGVSRLYGTLPDQPARLLPTSSCCRDRHAERGDGQRGCGVWSHELRIVLVVDAPLVSEDVDQHAAGEVELHAAVRCNRGGRLFAQLLLQQRDGVFGAFESGRKRIRRSAAR